MEGRTTLKNAKGRTPFILKSGESQCYDYNKYILLLGFHEHIFDLIVMLWQRVMNSSLLTRQPMSPSYCSAESFP